MITDILTLPKAGRYARPQNTNDTLPLVYGDMTENSPTGVWNCPCIDTTAHLYCVAGWAIQTEAQGNVISVYDGGTLLSTGFTFTASQDVEGMGTIATLTFDSAPAGTVSVKCKGKADSAGALITNPADVIADVLTYADAQGVSVPQMDNTAFSAARYASAAKGYTCAGVMLSDNSVIFWINAMLASFLGDGYSDHEGRFVIRFDTGLSFLYAPVGITSERNSTISRSTSLKNLLNRIPINYAVDLSNSDKRFREDVNSAYFKTDDGTTTCSQASIAKYGIREPASAFNFDWTRNTATIQAIQTRLVEKYHQSVWLYDIIENGFANFTVEKGDYVLFSDRDTIDEDGLPMQNQIGQVLTWNPDLDAEKITWQLLDTEIYLPDETLKWDGTQTVGDGCSYGGDRIRARLA